MNTDNVRKFVLLATPEEYQTGLFWYSDVRQWVLYQSRLHNIPARNVGLVVSALSPRCPWERNLSDARRVLETAGRDITPPELGCGTFYKNVSKAIAAARGLLDIIPGPKVSSFLDNILNPQSTAVTVDVWAARAAEDDLDLNPIVRPANYDKYAAPYREVASELGLLPCQVQAIVWIVVQRLANRGGNNKTRRHNWTQLALAL